MAVLRLPLFCRLEYSTRFPLTHSDSNSNYLSLASSSIFEFSLSLRCSFASVGIHLLAIHRAYCIYPARLNRDCDTLLLSLSKSYIPRPSLNPHPPRYSWLFSFKSANPPLSSQTEALDSLGSLLNHSITVRHI